VVGDVVVDVVGDDAVNVNEMLHPLRIDSTTCAAIGWYVPRASSKILLAASRVGGFECSSV